MFILCYYFILLPSCSVVLCEDMIFGGNSVLAVAELNKKTSVSK